MGKAIIGGARESGYPATGMLKLKRDGDTHTCTGTLIRADAVVTAAHCGVNDEGEQDVQEGTFELPSQTVEIRQVSVPTIYLTMRAQKDPKVRDYDVAVVLLAEPVQGVQPARIGNLTEAQ